MNMTEILFLLHKWLVSKLDTFINTYICVSACFYTHRWNGFDGPILSTLCLIEVIPNILMIPTYMSLFYSSVRIDSPAFHQGPFLPEASCGLRVLSLPASVCLRVCACVCPSVYVSPISDHRCKTPWLRSLLSFVSFSPRLLHGPESFTVSIPCMYLFT